MDWETRTRLARAGEATPTREWAERPRRFAAAVARETLTSVGEVPGPAVWTNGHFGGQDTETVQERGEEPEAGPPPSGGGAVASQLGWLFRQLSGAESTGNLLSEHSPPEYRVTRTIGTQHTDELREVGSSGPSTGSQHRGAGSRTPGA